MPRIKRVFADCFHPRCGQSQRPDRSAAVNSPSPSSIVLVDDERSCTDLLAQMLADNLSAPVHASIRPGAALAQLAGLHPAVVVTDYYMPDLNGLDFIRQATPIVPAAAFVLITGHNLSAETDNMARLPALKGFLAKPFGWRKLADEIIRVWPVPESPPSLRLNVAAR
jgi:DNA-binding NtrC family response regulator